MIKLITAIYLFCSIYSSNPQITHEDLSQRFIDGIIYEDIFIISDTSLEGDAPSQIIEKQPEVEIEDYIEELKKLNYLREESTDKNLNIRNGVLRFQSDHNLATTGVWDDICLAALKKRKEDPQFNHTDKVTDPPTEGKWIVINKDKRILTLYEGKKVYAKYPIAVGNPPSLTPSGKYTIANRIINPAWGGGGYAKPVAGGSPNNPLGYRWLGISLKGGGAYGIHGNNRPYSIGTNASHGCIRMINSDVEKLFEIVQVSNPVWLGTNSELTKWGVTQHPY